MVLYTREGKTVYFLTFFGFQRKCFGYMQTSNRGNFRLTPARKFVEESYIDEKPHFFNKLRYIQNTKK